MARNPKWLRRFNSVTCDRVNHPAFNRLLRFMWHYASKNGNWIADVLAGRPLKH